MYIPYLIWPSLYEVNDSKILVFDDGEIEATILSLQWIPESGLYIPESNLLITVIPSTNIYWVPILIKTLFIGIVPGHRANRKSLGF